MEPPAVAILNYKTVREVVTLSRIFFSNWDFDGFSLYTFNIAGRKSETAMGRGGESNPFCMLVSLKRQGRVARPELTSYIIDEENSLHFYYQFTPKCK